MRLNGELETAFRKKYKTCVYNFSKELMDFCDAVVETMEEKGEMESMSTLEDFDRFAIDAMIWKAVKLATDYKGQYDLLHEAKDLLDR